MALAERAVSENWDKVGDKVGGREGPGRAMRWYIAAAVPDDIRMSAAPSTFIGGAMGC